jgi:cell division protein FtsI (penicillin-binding protein 3)
MDVFYPKIVKRVKGHLYVNEEQNLRRIKKIFFTIILILLGFIGVFFAVKNTINDDRNLPRLVTSKQDLAVRGDIISFDNFKIATSEKIFTASIDSRSIDLDKKDLFIKLFSMYSNIDSKTIREKLNKSLKKPGYLILSREISSRDAKNLKLLAYKLRKLGVFKSIKINGSKVLYGLSIYETGESRLYPYKDTLTPVVGYIRKKNNEEGNLRVNGVKGIEKSYNSILNNLQNGELKGERDISSYIIFNSDSTIQTRRDGETVELNIPLRLQKNIELILDIYNKKLGSQEIIASILDSQTGQVLALASSNRFNPTDIKQNEIPYLNVNAIEYQYEPGSVIKPISIALGIEENKVNRNDIFFAHNKGKKNSKGVYPRGKIKVGRWWIKDDHEFEKHWLSLDDIVIFSSNIGTLQIVNKLTGRQILDGYHKFGLGTKTGIDLPYEKYGDLPSIHQLSAGESEGKLNVFKSTVSYGQGMTSTFMQILRAYSVFNNEGKIITPKIVKNLLSHEPEQIITPKTANLMKKLLIKTVNEGTGKKAFFEGLEVGGKTGTANIAENGQYKRKYMSSFFGFVNDKSNRYTIGVTVNDPISTGKYWYYYYASESAVPVFKEIVDIMLKLGYLKPF